MLDPSDVFLGTNAGLAKKQGLANSIQAFLNDLPGSGNIGIGSQALAASIANNNTAVGASALAADSSGNSNVAIGNLALSANKNGNNNTAVGLNAGASVTTGSNNSFLGTNADVTGGALTNATAIGYTAKVGASNSLVLGGTGGNAVKVGIGNTNPQNTLHVTPKTGVNPVRFEGLQASTSSKDKIVVADSTGVLRTTTITGGSGGWSLTGNAGTTLANNFLGTTDNVPLQFMVNNAPAGMLQPDNVYLGLNAGLASGKKYNPAILGIDNGGSSTINVDNVAIGNLALAANQSSSFNTAIGASALASSIGTGENSGMNTAVGSSAMTKNTTGFANTGLGAGALMSNTTGLLNTAVGLNSGLLNTTGNTNTAIGASAGGRNIGSSNTFIGANADVASTLGVPISNSTAIGSGAIVGASNSIVLGPAAGSTSLGSAVNVGIGNTIPTNTLHVTPKTGVNPVRFEGLQASTSSKDKIVVADSTGVLKIVAQPGGATATEPWFVQGAGSTTQATSNTQDIFTMGKVAIGQTAPFGSPTNEVLSVNGSIRTASNTYADYVFEDYFDGISKIKADYKYKSLAEVAEFIKANKHLPGVTSIKDLPKTAAGYSFNLTDLSVQSLEKLEELYLHVIEQQKQIEAKDKEVEALKADAKLMNERLNKLEKLLINK